MIKRREERKRQILLLPLLVLALSSGTILQVKCDIAFGSDGAEELTLAIVNISSMEPFTGFASNFKDDTGAKFTSFGSAKIGTISGLLVRVVTGEKGLNDACESIDPSQWASEPWILVAQHGNCKDDQKMKNIVRTNASAALIYDNKPNPRLVKLKFSNMISVFITKSKGDELLNLMENGTRMFAHLTVGPHSTFRYANINRTSVLFVSVSFIILMIISLAWLIFYYIQRFRYIQAKDILARRLGTAAKKALEKIPTKTLRSTDLQANPATAPHGDFMECCAVCIETFKPADLVRILPCKHVFHKTCVDPWLLDQRSCPMCKLDILKFFGMTIFTGSEENIFSEGLERSTRTRRDRRVRGSDDVEVIHIPIPSRVHRDSRSPSSHQHSLPIRQSSSAPIAARCGREMGSTAPMMPGTVSSTNPALGDIDPVTCSKSSFSSGKLSGSSMEVNVLIEKIPTDADDLPTLVAAKTETAPVVSHLETLSPSLGIVDAADAVAPVDSASTMRKKFLKS